MDGPRLVFRFWTGSGPTDYWQFDADGEWELVDRERIYRLFEPPQLENIRRSWVIHGTVLTPDSSATAGWARFQTILDTLEKRGTGAPTKVQLVLVENASEAVVATIGPPNWQHFTIDEFEIEPDTQNRPAHMLTEFGVRMVVSAQRVLTIGGTGPDKDVVGLEQTVSERAINGLREVTWTTTVTTAEGVDATPIAKALGLIPADLYGTSYTYKGTNNDDGVTLETLDPDARSGSSRVPTKVRATCVQQQWGVVVGTVSPGTSPDEVSVLDTIDEDEEQTVRTREVTASGPNAQTFGRSKALTTFHRHTERFDSARREFTATWEVRDELGTVKTIVQCALSGGADDFDFEPIPGGFDPIRFEGSRREWRLDVSVEVSRRGGTGVATQLPLPPLLGSPWLLDQNASTEGSPYKAEWAATAAKVKWARDARYVYKSPTTPKEDPAATIERQAGAFVASLFLGGAAAGVK